MAGPDLLGIPSPHEGSTICEMQLVYVCAPMRAFESGRLAARMSMNRSMLIPIVLAMWVSPARTQGPGNEPTTIVAISPIFSELVMFSLPKGFRTVFERTSGKNYVREAVVEGETVERWSQMITVTGAKDLASNPNASPQWLVERISAGFKRACPDSFAVTALGAVKVSGHDGF